MTDQTFQAMVVRHVDGCGYTRVIEPRSIDDLPDGDLLIRVHYSSLNYKDALSATGNRGVTRRYPHTPGIDAAGVVEASRDNRFAPGDEVIVIGYDLGMNTSGGFGQYVRVPADWAVKRPRGLSLHESMIYGTAGFTAAMSIWRLLEHGLSPGDGPASGPGRGEVLVTGATGGVGSMAVALLALEGFEVVAATGKSDQEEHLKALGATTVVHRCQINDTPRPLLRERWAGVVDTVGGDLLATALAMTRYDGAVTCCGLVAGPQLNTFVYPFILRGVSLLGIDSVQCSMAFRRELWGKIAGDWNLDNLDAIARTVKLNELDPEIDRILAGEQVGRVVVDLRG